MIHHQGPLVHIGIAIAAGAICSIWFYFKGRRDERNNPTK